MSSRYDQEIEQLLAEYAEQRKQAAQIRRRINEATGTGTAPRQSVKVTVTAQGEVTAIEFPTSAFRRMAAKELADALMAAFAQARQNALEQVTELTVPGLPAGLDAREVLQGSFDPTTLIPEVPPMPEVVRAYVDGGREAGGSGG